MSDNTQELREKILKVCHKYEDKEFMAVHGKCDMDLAALRCAKRVKELEALIKSQTNQAVLEALDRRICRLCFKRWHRNNGQDICREPCKWAKSHPTSGANPGGTD